MSKGFGLGAVLCVAVVAVSPAKVASGSFAGNAAQPACPESLSCDVRGDVNCDGVVTSADVTTLIDLLYCEPCNDCINQDVNGDGLISAADVSALVDLIGTGLLQHPEDAVFVSSTIGNDTNPGTKDAPKRTISAGIQAASAGHPVCVDHGTYNESLTLKSVVSVIGGFDSSKGWAITGATTTVKGSSTAVSANNVNFVTIQNLTIVASSNTAPGEARTG